jgi:hypothetical protein
MTLLSFVSDIIDIVQKTAYHLWDIILCISIIIRSVVTAIEYMGIKDGHVTETGPFATACRQIVFVGYQVSEITSGVSEALDELQIRNKASALNILVGELGITEDGQIAPDALLRQWLQRSDSALLAPVAPMDPVDPTLDADYVRWQGLFDQMYTMKQNVQAIDIPSPKTKIELTTPDTG